MVRGKKLVFFACTLLVTSIAFSFSEPSEQGFSRFGVIASLHAVTPIDNDRFFDNGISGDVFVSYSVMRSVALIGGAEFCHLPLVNVFGDPVIFTGGSLGARVSLRPMETIEVALAPTAGFRSVKYRELERMMPAFGFDVTLGKDILPVLNVFADVGYRMIVAETLDQILMNGIIWGFGIAWRL